ncbi:unnamed protein product [Acanthoscelides obtectus]|uniref:SWIM-type domain-containing protein n=1 Tax=Acanthoscelides obtectus TaxID=200917 RepID=A0A9P0PDS4_ACAOB|nr:unnamed protein product [Acanthoscelides obtectus]CAK1672097.1 hypothetical protein AOBTE_LOCUS28645 [Acanthoscelides obtectus]
MGRLETKNKYIDKAKINGIVCTQVEENIYNVQSKENNYIVNTEIESCTCFMGNRGGSCKHQLAIVTQFAVNSQQFHPTLINSDFKELLLKVVYGVNCEIEGWYLNLNDTKANQVVKIYNNSSAIEVPSCSSPDLHNIDINLNDIPPISTIEKDKIRGQLEHFVDLLMNRFENNYDEFNQPILKFLKNVESCKTNSSLTSALCTFGKYNGTGLPKIKSGKNIQGGNRIGVQPTAIMRRKSGLWGRNIAQSGRPLKRLRLSNHAYSKEKSKHNFEVFYPDNKTAAPHCLEYCITQNISLGKTHSKK